MRDHFGDFRVPHAAFTGVQSGAEIEAEIVEVLADRDRASDRAVRAGEPDEGAIGGLNSVTVVASRLVADDAPVLIDELEPCAVVDRRHPNTGSSEIGEQDRGEAALRRL